LLLGLAVFIFTRENSKIFQDPRVLFTTWQAYLPVIWRNPFGIPNAVTYLEALDNPTTYEFVDALSNARGKIVAPHNLFLTTGVSFGPLAALALGVLYWTALRNGRSSLVTLYRMGHIGNALWVLCLLAANIAIITHSWFHNASIGMGEMRNWLWLGLLQSNVQIIKRSLENE